MRVRLERISPRYFRSTPLSCRFSCLDFYGSEFFNRIGQLRTVVPSTRCVRFRTGCCRYLAWTPESASSRSRGPPADKITSPIPVTVCRTPEDFDGAV